MGQIDNLNQGQLAALIGRIEKLERGTPVNNAAIGRSGLLVYGGGVITIENGGLYVTGTAEIIGNLIASGVIDFTGDVTISGPLDVTGLMTLAGDLVVASGGKITAGTIELNPDGSARFGTMTISPAGKITSGSAEINPDGSAKFGNLTIDTAGKVTMGGMIIDPGLLGGAIQFSNGATLAAVGGSFVISSPTLISIQGDIGMNEDVFMTGLPATTQPANLYVNSFGQLFKSTT